MSAEKRDEQAEAQTEPAKNDNDEDVTAPVDVLAVAVEEAEQLMLYAVRQGLPIPDEILKSVVSIDRDKLGEWSDDQEVQFWKAALGLSKLVQPASIESIRGTSVLKSTPPSADKSINAYTLVAVGLLIALIIGQIYWVFGTNITNAIDRLTEANAKLQTEAYAAQYRLSGGRVPAAGAGDSATASAASNEQRVASSAAPENPAELLKIIKTNELLIEQNEQALNAERILLDWWMSKNPLAPKGNTPSWFRTWRMSAEEIKEEDEMIAAEKKSRKWILLDSAKLTLKSMSAYILPFLYGWLGAVAYILRSLSREISEVTFSRASAVRFQLRMALGMLSGITVGLILTPETIPTPLAAITPLALAFIAGYSVELLFSAMDRIIGAFSSEPTRTGPR